MNEVDRTAKESIEARVKEIESLKDEVRRKVKTEPDFAEKFLEEAKLATNQGIDELLPPLDELILHVKAIRKHVSSPLDQTIDAACYMLLGRVTKALRSAVTLGRGGFYYEFMELARSITESLDLVQLFIIEGDASPNLPKWFEGVIVSNATARDVIGKEFDQNKELILKEMNISPEVMAEMKKGNYGALSKFNHSSYAAILDSYDRINEDFDFNDLAGYHFMRQSGVRQFKQMLEFSYVSVKKYFASIGDKENFNAAQESMDRFSDVSSPERLEQSKEIAKDMSERFAK